MKLATVVVVAAIKITTFMVKSAPTQAMPARRTRLHRNGNVKESRLCYMGHALMENRHGLAVDGGITLASDTAEREAALAMLDAGRLA